DLRVDEAERLPPVPDLRQQLGAVAAHLLRRLAQLEHLLEHSLHLRVAGHGRRLLKLAACQRAAWAGAGPPAAPPAGAGPRSGAAARSSGKPPPPPPPRHASAPECRPARRPPALPRGGLRLPPGCAARPG